MKEYIKMMRELVGSRPIMQCGASVILVNERGELLLQQRADNGMWGYHGGSVEWSFLKTWRKPLAGSLRRKQG